MGVNSLPKTVARPDSIAVLPVTSPKCLVGRAELSFCVFHVSIDHYDVFVSCLVHSVPNQEIEAGK